MGADRRVPEYVTEGAVSTEARGDSTTMCVTAGDRDHNVIDSSIVDCCDVVRTPLTPSSGRAMHGAPRTDRPVSDPLGPRCRRVRRRAVGLRRGARRARRHQDPRARARGRPPIRERFVREAQLLRRVRSAHVIAVHDIGELDDGRPFFVMELASGGVLADRIDPGGRVDAEGVAATITALAGGLGALHAAGIVHRDVKPANLLIVGDSPRPATTAATVQRPGLLAPGERIVIGDLGLAKDQDRTAADPRSSAARRTTGHPNRLGEAQRSARRPTCTRRPRGVEPAHRRCRRRRVDARCAARHGSAGVARVLRPRPRSGARGAIRHDARVGGGRARGARRATGPVDGRFPRRGARAPPVRTRAWRRISPRTPRSSSGARRWSTNSSRRLQSRRTLVIGGPSGSGKSSLLRAGLVPAHRRGRVARQPALAGAPVHPGPDALDELAHQLGRLHPSIDGADADAAARRIRECGPAVGSLPAPRLARHRPVRGAAHARHRRRPIGRRSSTSWRRSPRREDAHGPRGARLPSRLLLRRARRYPWLADRISANQVLVGPMRRARAEACDRRAGAARRAPARGRPRPSDPRRGRRRAGRAPARRARPDGDLAAPPRDAAHTRRLPGGRRRRRRHRAIGRARVRTPRRDERVAARRLFLRLVPRATTHPTRGGVISVGRDRHRRRTARESSTRSPNERLLTVDDRGVEIVHETLIRTWPRLRDWIDENRDDLRMRTAAHAGRREWAGAGPRS